MSDAVDDQVQPDGVLAEDPPVVKQPKKRKRKKSRKKMYMLIGFGLFSFIIWFGLQRPQGTVKFAICRTFIEQTLTYPMDLRPSTVQENNTMVRMEYTTVNEYGEYILSTIICVFHPDDRVGWVLDDVRLNRAKYPPDKVKAFNAAIPYIIANPGDLTLPPPLTGNLRELQNR